ncbi:MAG: hypothetical protein MJ147_02970 [Clostridia bacterium]|nr:hypothetical protein [Clostridia bacterium]
MSKNLLVSVAMLTTFWEKEQKDNIELLLPFFKYSIYKVNTLGDIIDIEKTISFFKTEFGYSEFPLAVALKVCDRLCKSCLKKEKNKYILQKNLDSFVHDFERKN